MTRDLQTFCRAERDWLIETTEALVRLESPTTDKAAVDRCGAELASRLEAIGGRVTRLSRLDRGDHLRAEFGPAARPEARRAWSSGVGNTAKTALLLGVLSVLKEIEAGASARTR